MRMHRDDQAVIERGSGMAARDRAFWISWYDLPGDADGHLAWVHDAYVPTMLKRPGVLWGAHYRAVRTAPGDHMIRTKDPSVPNGSDYILVFAGEDTAAFTRGEDHFRKGGPSRLERGLTDRDTRMLAMR